MRYNFFLILIVFLIFSGCKNSESAKEDSLKIITEKNLNEYYFYSKFFIENNIKKEQNYYFDSELIDKKKDNFLYLYKYKNHNDSVKICFLKVKSGRMFEYDIIKSNNKYVINRFKEYQTKVEDNEGTNLYYKIIDSN